MAFRSGFFNSVNGDRKYDATQMDQLFGAIISDGIFRDLENGFAVTASGSPGITVTPGWAWFNGTWTHNEDSYYYSLPSPPSGTPRYDAVVLEINTTDNVRANSIKILSGTAATTPVKPTLTKANGVFQYALAYVLRKPAVADVTQADVQSVIGNAETPWATNRLASAREKPSITVGTADPSGGADGDIYFKVV